MGQSQKVLWVGFKFTEKMARGTMYICLWVLKENTKSSFDNTVCYHIPEYLAGLSRMLFSNDPFLKQLIFNKVFHL